MCLPADTLPDPGHPVGGLSTGGAALGAAPTIGGMPEANRPRVRHRRTAYRIPATDATSVERQASTLPDMSTPADPRKTKRRRRLLSGIVVAAGLVAIAGLAQKAACWDTAWGSPASFARLCYSDMPYLYPRRGLAELTIPFADTTGRFMAMEYPALAWLIAFATAAATWLLAGRSDLEARRALPPDAVPAAVNTEAGLYLLVNGALLVTCVVIGALVLTRWRPQDSPRAAWMWALSPAILFTGFINWDLLPALAVLLALFAAHRGRWIWCGVAIGLGVAVKLYPLLLLGPIFVLAVRDRRWRPFVTSSAAAGASWLAINIPAYLAGPDAWLMFWSFNSAREADLGSGWQVLRILGHPFSARQINLASAALVAAACLIVLAIGLRVHRRPSLAALGFLVVWAFLAVNKVYSPQYVLWLLPLAILARPRWRDILVWQISEVVYFIGVMLYVGQVTPPPAGIDKIYLSTVAIRYAGELWLVGCVLRDLLRSTPATPASPATAERVGLHP